MELYLILATIIGLLIGSFLNVCIYRVARKLSILSPYRSYCPNCKESLRCWHNIPVLSWICLLGKCSFCKTRISGQYPLVELLSAAFAFASILHFGPTITGVIVYILCATLIVITFIDLEFKIIPNVISFPGMIIGLLLGIFSQYTGLLNWPLTQDAFDSLLGFLLGGGFFYVISLFYYLCTKRIGLGGGDIKLLAMCGAVLGVSSVPPTIFAGSLAGASIGILLMVIKGSGRHTEIPFGPWLSLGALLYIFTDLSIFRFF